MAPDVLSAKAPDRAELPLPSNTYTVEQLAALLQCSERHVWRLSDQNKIPGKLRLGRLVRFARTQVDAWLADLSKSSRQ
ncbi:MAG TPA: helix-turn-helix domain-containing protein [Gemmataceae bacterium]|nr:helix-turn-helix domain-containing protein [Gemmataceae bacterium]